MPKRKLNFFTGMILLGMLLTSCSLPQKNTPVPSTPSEMPRAWIDSPLDGMQLPLDQVEIIAHGSDVGSVMAMEVLVNEVPLERGSGDNFSLPLVTFRSNWTPDGPGKYIIKVRSQNASDIWSEPAIATIWITQELALPSSTPIILPSNTPQPTSTTTLTPTVTSTITPTSTNTQQPEYIKDVSISPEAVSYYSDCPPNDITVQVHAFDPDGISLLSLYYRLKDNADGDVSDWHNLNVNRLEGDLYGIVFTPVSSDHPLGAFFKPGLENFGSSYNVQVQIQFVMQDSNRDIYRSDVYSMVTLYGCAP